MPMESSRINEDIKLRLLILAVFIIAIIAFWPLMTMFVWVTAVAVALFPLHKRLRGIVKNSVSATFITVWVLLVVLLFMLLTASVVLNNQEHIGNMALSVIDGAKNTGLSGFLPSFTEVQLADINKTLQDLIVNAFLSLTGNIMQTLISIIIFFLSLSLLLSYGDTIWNTVTGTLSPKLSDAVRRMSEISESTIYALLIVQISAAMISFALAIPFFYFLGCGDVLLFSTLIGLAMLIPLIGAQVMILFLALYFFSLGDTRGAAVMLFVGYPLLSGWVDFYYRPVMMKKRVAVHPVMMMIGIFAGLPFMGIVGFIIGPVLIALVVTGYKILAEEARNAKAGPSRT